MAVPSEPRARTIRVAAVLALIIMGLWLFDRFLAASETRERMSSAGDAYREGRALLEQRKTDQAIDLLRKAWVLERTNPEYALALGNALAAQGKTTEADRLIDEALDREPNDSEANLSEARLRVQEGDAAEAEPFYHRAIYGNWKDKAAERRAAARLELIELLRKERNQSQMLAELISLEGEQAAGTDLRRKLAPLFLEAGSPQRSADAWKAITQGGASEDPDAWSGLGEAELAMGVYREARTAFRKAEALRSDRQIRSRIDMLDMLIALDPTPRHLTSIEKYRRSRHILELVLADMVQVSTNAEGKDLTELTRLAQQARTEVARREPSHVTNEMSEGLLSLAQQLWQARLRAFGPPAQGQQEALRRMMDRVAG